MHTHIYINVCGEWGGGGGGGGLHNNNQKKKKKRRGRRRAKPTCNNLLRGREREAAVVKLDEGLGRLCRETEQRKIVGKLTTVIQWMVDNLCHVVNLAWGISGVGLGCWMTRVVSPITSAHVSIWIDE